MQLKREEAIQLRVDIDLLDPERELGAEANGTGPLTTNLTASTRPGESIRPRHRLKA